MFVDYAQRTGLQWAIPQVRERGTLIGVDVPDDVRSLFATALEIPIGLKGLTLSRFGSRASQVIQPGAGPRCEADACV